MVDSVLIFAEKDLPDVIRAINSALRRKIMKILYRKEININELAKMLKIPQSTCAVNVQALEKVGLIETRHVPASKGSQKICTTTCQEIVLSLLDETPTDNGSIIETEMPIGLFFDYRVDPTCGMASRDKIIGYNDQPSYFLDPHRATAQIIWFCGGYLEYRLPFDNHIVEHLKAVSISVEVCSEFPLHRNDWPSSITMWANGKDIGTWTSPGDMGGTRGRLNPAWWGPENTQYGFLKTWKVSREGSHIDGVSSSSTTISDLGLGKTGFITIRIGIKDDAENKGGMNILGRGFGNYNQDIRMRIELDRPVR